MSVARVAAIITVVLSTVIVGAEPSPSWADLYVVDLDRGVVGFTAGALRHLTISVVEPDSPAAAAGLQKSDHIVAIDGKSTSDIETHRDVRIRMAGVAGSIVQLQVASRDGHSRIVRLTRVPLGSLPRVKQRPNTLLSYFML